jgi:hypothetical protein
MVKQNPDKSMRAAGRVIAVAASMLFGLVLLMVVSPVAQSSGPEDGMPEGWQTIRLESFGAGMGATALLTDTSTTDGGEYYWGVSTFTSTSPITSAWAVGGGADGISLTAGVDTYTNNVDSWLVYGPLTLTNVFHAEFTFDWWLDSAPGDWFGWCLMPGSIDLEEGCAGASISGHIGTWVSGTVSIEQYAGTTTPLYLAFHFTSNDDGESGIGAFVDNVMVRGDYGLHQFLPLVRDDATPTPSSFMDDFSDNNSGWRRDYVYRDNTDMASPPECNPGEEDQLVGLVSYKDGHYRIRVDLDCRWGGDSQTWFVHPVVRAPLPDPVAEHYVIEARGMIYNSPPEDPYQPWWAHWGLVFAANNGLTDVYAFRVNIQKHFSVARFHPYIWPGDRTIDYVIDWTGEISQINNGPVYNTLRVEVEGNKARFWVNGFKVGSVWIDGLRDYTRVGLIGGDIEVTPVDVRIDYFSYEVLD